MGIYTKGGDKGQTSLLGGSRIDKDSLRVECYGIMDEALSQMGVCYSIIKDDEMKGILRHVQERIFMLNAELASDEKGLSYIKSRINEEDVSYLENIIDGYQRILGPQHEFIIPGDTYISSLLHVARTIVRRAERSIVTLSKTENVSESIKKFVNRLSDTLYVLARMECYKYRVNLVTKEVMKILSVKKGGFNVMNLDLAKKLCVKAEERAVAIKVPMVITIVDTGGNVVLMHRMDDSLLVSIGVSRNKAYSAVAVKMPTDKLGEVTQPGQSLYGIQHSDKKMITFGGGFPIYEDGKIIGGIGVSGGSVEEDMDVAQYALK